MNEQELREALAAYAHEAWSGWMRYLFDRGELHPDGSFTIPVELVLHWQRQMRTPYMELPEDEKRSDRKEADEMLAIFAQSHAAALLRAVEGLEAAIQPSSKLQVSYMEEDGDRPPRFVALLYDTRNANGWRSGLLFGRDTLATALIDTASAAQIGAGDA